jgi:DnaJ-class molecular chaperone
MLGPISVDVIKSRYKSAALKLHPDKHVHSDEATQRRSMERFRRLQVAYEVLKDVEKRRAYDQGRLVH